MSAEDTTCLIRTTVKPTRKARVRFQNQSLALTVNQPRRRRANSAVARMLRGYDDSDCFWSASAIFLAPVPGIRSHRPACRFMFCEPATSEVEERTTRKVVSCSSSTDTHSTRMLVADAGGRSQWSRGTRIKPFRHTNIFTSSGNSLSPHRPPHLHSLL
ncbi:hypothetical protein BD626DRAFT_147500 [Schizophyllum amplum]|uniref:Uncharacterized protein n=1 Tax=Schizophyllum amplum TaxID=97359 RepID=A0A550C4H2_9AGAR|nr:hypothetical protein BD626DRAFT_147500 [Auriculariopsis ampla]